MNAIPGPYRAVHRVNGTIAILDGNDKVLALLFKTEADREQISATAELLASAPELLAQREELLALCKRLGAWIDHESSVMTEAEYLEHPHMKETEDILRAALQRCQGKGEK